ncbi:hypothetical protein ABFS83_05G124800 [Erythranthe nasuta]
MDSPMETQSPPQPESAAAVMEVEEQPENEADGEMEVLTARVKSLMDKITENSDNPSPILINAISTILESLESRYTNDQGQSSTFTSILGNAGRIMELIKENDAFFQLISSKILTDRRYSVSAKAATARLVFSCLPSWLYQLEDDVLDIIGGWVMDETTPDTLELETLQTYSIGALSRVFTLCLVCDSEPAERFLTSGLPAKLMQILRIEVLCAASSTSETKASLSKVGNKDITDLVKEFARAAEAEARASKSSEADISAAGVAAAEVVKSAAFEEYRKTNDENVAAYAAYKVASALIDDFNAVALSRYLNYFEGDWDHSNPEIDEDVGKFFVVDAESLSKLREKFCIQSLVCLLILWKDVDFLDSLLHEKAVDVCLALVQKCVGTDDGSNDYKLFWHDILKLVCELTEHEKFMVLFLDNGGLQKLLAGPRIPRSFHRLSSFLCTVTRDQSTMRCLCDLPSSVIRQVVELVFEILESEHEYYIARADVSSFLTSAFSYRAVLDVFDAHDGLEKLVNYLHHSASVTSGASTPLTYRQTQTAHETCAALHQYIRTQLLLFVDSILSVSSREPYKPINASNEAFDSLFRQIRNDEKLGATFIYCRWPSAYRFIRSNGHITLLELCQASQLTRTLQGSLQYIIEVLRILTLIRCIRSDIIDATLSNGRAAIAVVLDVINTPANFGPEIVDPALHMLVNLVCPPPFIPEDDFKDRAIADMEKCCCLARESICENNGIKILLRLLESRIFTSQADLVRRRVLTCRVLLGLAKDNSIARTLSKLELARRLLEINRDLGGKSSGIDEHNKWHAELDQLTIELISVTTNSGCASTVAADAFTPPLRRIEKAAIVEATPITYNPRELLVLIHGHLEASGLPESAAIVSKEAKLTDFQSSKEQIQLPCGRTPSGFFPDKSEGSSSSNQKHPVSRKNEPSTLPKIIIKLKDTPRKSKSLESEEAPPLIIRTPESDGESDIEILRPKKRKLTHSNEIGSERRLTLDSVMVEYLKLQHSKCSAPITTLPPLSLLHPHACPEPRQTLDAPTNMTARLRRCEVVGTAYGGIDVSRKDRRFVYSRFRHRETLYDKVDKSCLTSIAFIEDPTRVAACGFSRRLKFFDLSSATVCESSVCHTSDVTHLHSHSRLLLSSTSNEVCLWDGSSFAAHTFDGVKAARFDSQGTLFAALPSDSSLHEILLFDVQTLNLNTSLVDDTDSRVIRHENPYCEIHFGPLRYMLLWEGILWDYRSARPIHRFQEFTDLGGGGFHPAGNEVIINSEVCDLRNFKILRTVPSLHQTTIKFNSGGDVIYAILRRDRSDFKSAVNPRRMKHNLFSAFRTLDALNYTDIATIPIERCVLDFATEPTDSFVGLITMDNDGDMKGSLARIYDVGERNNPTDSDYGLQFNRNRNWNLNQNRNRNRDAEYDLHTVELDEDEEESEGNDYEETVNEDEEYESGSDLSLNIYRSEDEDN